MFRRLVKWLLVLLLVLVVALGSVFTWLVVRGFPQREGTVQIPALSAPVRVVRDQYGIANIYASTTDDLFAAEGWVHASERMWQMEVWRRIGAGRLSELFGDTALARDEYIRTLGWRHAAEADWEVMSDDGKQALEAYATGVNAWLDQHHDMPLPFVIAGLQGAGGGLAGFHPEPWTPIDTLAWQKVQAWSLGDNYGTELTRAVMLNRGLSVAQIDELAPPYDPSHPVIVPTAGAGAGVLSTSPSRSSSGSNVAELHLGSDGAEAMLETANDLRSTISLAGAGAALGGSNGFAVAPSRSATGGALLANDPHLDISMPSVWFLVGLHCQPVGPECPYDMAGAGFPGVPGLVLGHNGRIAWGLTNVGPDVQDVFEETVDPADDSHYMYKGQSLPFEERPESIAVAGGDPVDIEVRSTVHGTVISDVDEEFKPTDEGGAGIGEEGYVYSLAWTATMAPDRTLDSVLAVNRAANWDEFRNALRDFGAPSQTFVYADVDGHIGIQVPGWFPIRANGDGAYPVSGEDGTNDWTGLVPFEELPFLYDPPEGLIVAANNQPQEPSAGPFLGRDFDPGYRAARIHELLDELPTVTTDQLRTTQGDVKLTRAAPVVAALPSIKAATADGELLRQRVIEWGPTAQCNVDSVGCAAYETFEYRLLRGTLDDELGAGNEPDNAAWRYIGTETSHDFLARLMAQPDSEWWDDISTPSVETPDQVIAAALDAGASDLRGALGEPSNWTWGRIHTATFQEQTLGTSGIGPLEWIFNKGPFPAPGSCTTVYKDCGSIAADWPSQADAANLQLRFAVASSPSYRLVVDMSELDDATVIQTTGQSGVPFDSHYGDYIQRWLDNLPLALPFSAAAVDAAKVQVLTLRP